MRFYKRDPDAALSGMAELTLQERGAYNTILDLLYARDGLLPDDDEMLRRMLGCHGNEWRAVKAKLITKGKVWVEGGFIKAKRVDDVLKEAAAFSEAQRIRAGNRWEKAGKRAGNGAENADKGRIKDRKIQPNQSYDDAKRGNAYTPIDTDIAPTEHVHQDELLAFDEWNTFAEQHALAPCRKRTDPRRAKMRARLKDCGGIEGWRAALAKAATIPGLMGKAGGTWKLNLDALLQERTFTKLMEGAYDGWNGGHGTKPSLGPDGVRRAVLAGLGLGRNGASTVQGDDRPGGGGFEGDREEGSAGEREAGGGNPGAVVRLRG